MEEYAYMQRQMQGLLSESDDSSFVCQENEIDSQSSSQDSLFNQETREESYLENMYQFVTECFNCEQLMARLKVSKTVMIQRLVKYHSSSGKKKYDGDYTGDVDETRNEDIRRLYFKKPSYNPKLKEQKQTFSQIIVRNKYPLLFILVSIILVFLRIQDIQLIERDRQIKACLKQSSPTDSDLKPLKKCVETIIFNPTLFIFDYHLLFYGFLIICAGYFMYKNMKLNPILISHSDYFKEYKQIHNITTNEKISLRNLLKQKDSLHNQAQINQKAASHHVKGFNYTN